jgi:hypothetical protein
MRGISCSSTEFSSPKGGRHEKQFLICRGIEDKLQAQWLKENLELHDKLNIKLLEQGRLAKEVEKLHEEEAQKLKQKDEKANKAADAEEEEMDKRAESLVKREEELAIEAKVKTTERGWEADDATKGIGFQHQQGGAYAGLVGNQQNKDLSIAERNAKASEKLVQLAEHWARRDAVDKIKQGDGL